MKRLIRLYPRAWRARYGAEMEALLSDAPRSPRAIWDVMGAAARAQGRELAARAAEPGNQRRGAWAAMAGGVLWALTFMAGGVIAWGRLGTDLGTQLLLVAGLLLVATLPTFAVLSTSGRRPVAWLGALVGIIGGVLLPGAALAAFVLEPPLAIRLPMHSSELWAWGMLLVTVGSALTALAHAPSGPSLPGRIGTVLVAVTGPVLAVSLYVPFEGGIVDARYNAAGELIARLEMLAMPGWFVTSLPPLAAGVLFGAGWAALGWLRLRATTQVAIPEAPAAVDRPARSDVATGDLTDGSAGLGGRVPCDAERGRRGPGRHGSRWAP